MIATLWLASVALDVCAQCRLEEASTVLCRRHEVEERDVLGREARRLASKDVAERLAALDAVAVLTDAHTNAPSERVVQLLAKALADDVPEVRRRAVERLGSPQHAISALEALSKALDASRKEFERLDERYAKVSRKLAGKLSSKQREELSAEYDEVRGLRREQIAWRDALANRLADFPDQRALDAILRGTKPNLLVSDPVPLVRLGTRAAMRALVESVATADQVIALAEEAARAGDEAVVTSLGKTLPELQLLELQLQRTSAQARMTAELLARGLSPPLGKGATDWRAWLEQNVEAFPERLPGIASPAW